MQVSLFNLFNEGKHAEIIKAIESGAEVDVNEVDEKGRSILFREIQAHQDLVAITLINAGASFTNVALGENCEIVLTVQLNRNKVLRVMMEKLPSILSEDEITDLMNHKFMLGYTLLTYAVFNSNNFALKLILARRANPLQEDEMGGTPLKYAAERGQYLIVCDLVAVLPEKVDERLLKAARRATSYAKIAMLLQDRIKKQKELAAL